MFLAAGFGKQTCPQRSLRYRILIFPSTLENLVFWQVKQRLTIHNTLIII